MPREKVIIENSLRYSIFHGLDLEAKAGTIIDILIRTLPGPPKYITPHGDLPVGTVSEIVRYIVRANGWVVVKAHQYRLPDGSIRGGPDPKYIRLGDIVFVPPSPNQPVSL